MKIHNFNLLSAIIYLGISLLAAGLFFLVTLIQNYAWVARLGGSAWVFILSMIVLMPLVIPNVKKRMHVK